MLNLAVKWLESLVEDKNEEAMCQLGHMYSAGIGVKVDLEKAYSLFSESSDRGDLDATYQLAMMRLWGDGCEIDLAEAERLISKAAEEGHGEATSAIERLGVVDSQSSLDPRHKRIAKILMMLPREMGRYWPWLEKGIEPTKKDANKFFLFCVLDFQMKVETVISNVRRFTESVLGDPEDIWASIANHSKNDWEAKKREYNLQRFPFAHDRVWSIANEIVNKYDGDVRNVWKGRTPAEVLDILLKLVGGKQVPRMIIGALIDTGQIEGSGEVKADTHVKRVLGRAITGRGYSGKDINEITNITRTMYPHNPWLLDQPLYVLGQDICKKKDPRCNLCYLKKECAFHINNV